MYEGLRHSTEDVPACKLRISGNSLRVLEIRVTELMYYSQTNHCWHTSRKWAKIIYQNHKTLLEIIVVSL